MTATAAAGEKDVRLMGADVSQQFLEAGSIDEIRIQLAPVLFGDGRRLFGRLCTGPIALERLAIVESPYVTHLRFCITK